MEGMKKTSKAVKDSRARAGLRPTSLSMTDEQKAALDGFAADLGVGRVAAIMEAIDAYKGQGVITRERLLAEIGRRLR